MLEGYRGGEGSGGGRCGGDARFLLERCAAVGDGAHERAQVEVAVVDVAAEAIGEVELLGAVLTDTDICCACPVARLHMLLQVRLLCESASAGDAVEVFTLLVDDFLVFSAGKC